MRYAPTTGYVRPFKKLSRFRPLRGRGVGVCDTPLRPGMCGPSKNYPVFVFFGAVCGAYAKRPYDRVRAILRNTDAIFQPGTCEGSKNGSVYATVGGVCGAYAIRPYNWIRVTLRNTDVIPQPGTCESSKNGSVFATVGGVCGAYTIRPYNRARVALQKTLLFSSLSGPSGVRIRYAPTTGYVRSFEIPM